MQNSTMQVRLKDVRRKLLELTGEKKEAVSLGALAKLALIFGVGGLSLSALRNYLSIAFSSDVLSPKYPSDFLFGQDKTISEIKEEVEKRKEKELGKTISEEKIVGETKKGQVGALLSLLSLAGAGFPLTGLAARGGKDLGEDLSKSVFKKYLSSIHEEGRQQYIKELKETLKLRDIDEITTEDFKELPVDLQTKLIAYISRATGRPHEEIVDVFYPDTGKKREMKKRAGLLDFILGTVALPSAVRDINVPMMQPTSSLISVLKSWEPKIYKELYYSSLFPRYISEAEIMIAREKSDKDKKKKKVYDIEDVMSTPEEITPDERGVPEEAELEALKRRIEKKRRAIK